MASLVDTTVNGDLNINGNTYRTGGSNITPWQQLSHCVCPSSDGTSDCIGNGRAYLHVRTPLPADNVVMGWNPIILEVVGYHTYSGENVHDFKALLNTNGYDNSWYGSQIKTNSSLTGSNPYVYRSTNTYGGYTRVCFAVNKISCCCTGNLWVRWWNNTSYFTDYPWATETADTNSFQRF